MQMDFIPEMTKHLMSHYPLNETWAQLLSATTLSSTLTYDTFYTTGKGPNACNLWVAYFAPSGDFKSVPIDNVTIPLLRAVGKTQERYLILPSIASTIEGLIMGFKQDVKNRNGVILRDELTTLFKEVHKDYMTEEMETYSLMYDGKIFPRKTMKFASRDVIYVYVNLIGATTPRYLYETMTEKFFFQGTGNRFLYVKHKLPSQSNCTKEDLFSTNQKWLMDGIPAELTPFYDFLIKVSEVPYDIIIMDNNVLEASTKYHNEQELMKDQINETDPEAFKKEYISRNWQKSLKLAQLNCLGRKGLNPGSLIDTGNGKRVIELEMEDLELGQKIVSQCNEYFKQIITEWKGYVKTGDKPITTDVKTALKYLNAVREYGIISQSKLAYVVGNISRDDEFYNILGYLINVGCIEQMSECRDFILKEGKQWMEQQMISPSFKVCPKLYKYIKDMPS